jgi:hypothetical protein
MDVLMRPRSVIATASLSIAAAAACASIIDASHPLTCDVSDASTGSIDTCMSNDGVTIYSTSGELHDLLWIGEAGAGNVFGAGVSGSQFAVQLLLPDAAIGKPTREALASSSANAVVATSAANEVAVAGGSSDRVVVNTYSLDVLSRTGNTVLLTGPMTTLPLEAGVAASYDGYKGVYVYGTTGTNDVDIARLGIDNNPPPNEDVAYTGSVPLRARDGVFSQVGDAGSRLVILGDSPDGPPGIVMVAYHGGSLARDVSFGTNGVVSRTFAGGNARAIIFTDSYWVAGEAADAGGMIVAHFNTDGTLDTTYANQGFAIAPGTTRGATAILDAKNALLVAGFDQGRLAIGRFTYDAGVDTTFGEGGVLTLDVPGELRALKTGDSKHYIAGGFANVDGGTSWVVVWLLR